MNINSTFINIDGLYGNSNIIDSNIENMFDLSLIGYDINKLDKERTTIIIQSYCQHRDINRMNILLYTLTRYRTYCLAIHDIVLIWGCNIHQINDKILSKIKSINESKIECKEPNINKKRYYEWYKAVNRSYNNLTAPNIYVYVKMTSTLSHRWRILDFHKFNTLTAISHDDDNIFNQLHFYCFLNTFNILQFNKTNNNEEEIFSLNDMIHSNNITILGVLGHTTRHYMDINDWYNETEREKYIQELNKTIGIHPLLQKRMWFKYSSWSNAPRHNLSFDVIMPGNGLVVPIYLYKIISDEFVKYNLIHIIDNQPAMCDDIAYSLALYHYFSGKYRKNKLFLKRYVPNNYNALKLIRYDNKDKTYFKQNKYPLINMILQDWEDYIYEPDLNDLDYFDMKHYKLQSNDINTSIKSEKHLSSRGYRSYYRHECINLLLWQYKKQYLNDINFLESLNIHRHFTYNSDIRHSCFG